ncbi:MAG: flagellar hook capping FlgD N-terminal domain-containing protein [Parvibaculum sp.]
MEAVSSILSTTVQSTSGSSDAQNSLNKNFDLFLSLLTTQLKNQDPLDPTDTNEMTSQLVQFSSVEQTIATNAKLEELIALTQSQSTGRAVEYIGKDVEALGSVQKLETDGEANWRYSIADTATEVVLSVVDANGAAVYSQTLSSTDAGTYDFTWQGETADGQTAAPGSYFLSVTAKNSTGDPIQTDTRISGRVSEVDYTGDTPILLLGDIPIKLSDITSVKAAGT